MQYNSVLHEKKLCNINPGIIWVDGQLKIRGIGNDDGVNL